MQDQPPSGASDRGRDREQPESEPFRFPFAGFGGGVGEQAHPGGELRGEGDELAPDPVLIEALQRQVAQSGVFPEPDAVLAAGPAPVAELEVGQLTAGRVGGERGEPVPVDVLEPTRRRGGVVRVGR